MASLSDASTPRLVGDRYQLEVASGWRQGRGVFGGLVVGALVRAIEQHTADPDRKVRSVTAELPGPVEHGTVDITVETLRQGKNVSTARAALSQHGEVRSHAVAILSAARATARPVAWNDLTRPELPPWIDVAPSKIGIDGGPGPEFAQHFEYRIVEGALMSGSTAPLRGWIRPRQPGALRDAAYVAAMIDAWWPVAFVRLGELRPMATIAFTLDIVAGLEGLDPMAPLGYRAIAPVCADGYCLETRELWGEDGRLVAINQQTFAVIQ
jgi:Thioesterase-like superfamily